MYKPHFFPQDDMLRLSAAQFNEQIIQIESKLKEGTLDVSQIKNLYYAAIIDRLYSIEKEHLEKKVASPNIKKADLDTDEKILFDLLLTSFHSNGRSDYIPTLIRELNNKDLRIQLLSHLQESQLWLQEQRLQTTKARAKFIEEQNPAKQIIKHLKAAATEVVNSNDSIESNPALFMELSTLWDNTTSGNDIMFKIKVLLNYYLSGNANEDSFSLFRWLASDHYDDISNLKQQCNDKSITDPYHLLGVLLNIKERNSTGHLQTIIAVIVSKLREEQASDSELLSSIQQRRSLSLPSFSYD